MPQFTFPADTPLTQRIAENPPHWASRKLEAWDEDGFNQLLPFIVEKYWSSQESINVFNVVGTKHPSYIGMSWTEFLQQGVRMRENLRLQESNPDYYLDTTVKQPTMLYVSLDSDLLYVNGDGNHRTAIARFMFHELGKTTLHGVTVERYRSDRESYRLYREIRESALRQGRSFDIRPLNTAVSRDDTGGWMRELYEVKLEIVDLSTGNKSVLARDEFAPFLKSLTRKKSLLSGIASFLRRR